jgi:hypothetical protein
MTEPFFLLEKTFFTLPTEQWAVRITVFAAASFLPFTLGTTQARGPPENVRVTEADVDNETELEPVAAQPLNVAADSEAAQKSEPPPPPAPPDAAPAQLLHGVSPDPPPPPP